jgi:hypothetical protein
VAEELAASRIEGLIYRRELLERAGGVLGGVEAGRLLGLTRAAVDKQRRRGQLLAVDIGRPGWCYPAFQFTGDGTLAGLAEVLEALRLPDGWAVLAFFLEEAEELGGRTPAEALAAGDLEAVVGVASLYGEHAAR